MREASGAQALVEEEARKRMEAEAELSAALSKLEDLMERLDQETATRADLEKKLADMDVVLRTAKEQL